MGPHALKWVRALCNGFTANLKRAHMQRYKTMFCFRKESQSGKFADKCTEEIDGEYDVVIHDTSSVLEHIDWCIGR